MILAIVAVLGVAVICLAVVVVLAVESGRRRDN